MITKKDGVQSTVKQQVQNIVIHVTQQSVHYYFP
jgi:hypothetical protein